MTVERKEGERQRKEDGGVTGDKSGEKTNKEGRWRRPCDSWVGEGRRTRREHGGGHVRVEENRREKKGRWRDNGERGGQEGRVGGRTMESRE